MTDMPLGGLAGADDSYGSLCAKERKGVCENNLEAMPPTPGENPYSEGGCFFAA